MATKVLKTQQTVKVNGELNIVHAETSVDLIEKLDITAWATGKEYVKRQIVVNEGKLYQAKSDHTAAAKFEDDMATGSEKWTLIPISGGTNIIMQKDQPKDEEINNGDFWFKILD